MIFKSLSACVHLQNIKLKIVGKCNFLLLGEFLLKTKLTSILFMFTLKIKKKLWSEKWAAIFFKFGILGNY